MTPIRIQLWQEEIPLAEVFVQLHQEGLELPTLKEIGKKLLYLKSIQEYHIDPPGPEKIEELMQVFLTKFKLDTPEALENWYLRNGQSKERLTRQLVHQDQLNRLRKTVVSEEMMKEAFLKRKAKMDSVVFRLIRVDSEALAQELYHRIVDDREDFGELAKQFSTGTEAPAGGMVGPRPIIELNPELRSILQTLKPGEVSQPFTLDGQMYLIIRLLKMDYAQLTPMLEHSIREELFEQWAERQLSLAGFRLLMDDDMPGSPDIELEAGLK